MKSSETDLSVGREHEMAFPFYKTKLEGSSGHFGSPITKASYFWYGGCNVHFEQYDEGHGEIFFTAHGEGKVIYKVLSVAKMPGRYQDRVIFKRWLIDPDGNKYNNGEVRMLTKKSFCRDVASRTPFRVDYELESDDD